MEGVSDTEEEMGHVVHIPQFGTAILSPVWTTATLLERPPRRAEELHKYVPYAMHALQFIDQILVAQDIIRALWVQPPDVDLLYATGTCNYVGPHTLIGNDHTKGMGSDKVSVTLPGACAPEFPLAPESRLRQLRADAAEIVAVYFTTPTAAPVMPMYFIPSARLLQENTMGIISGIPSPGIHNFISETKIQFYSKLHPVAYQALEHTFGTDLSARLRMADKTLRPSAMDFVQLFQAGFIIHHTPAQILEVLPDGMATFAGSTTKGYCGSLFRPVGPGLSGHLFCGVVTGPKRYAGGWQNTMYSVVHPCVVEAYCQAAADYWYSQPSSPTRSAAADYFTDVRDIISSLSDRVPISALYLAGLKPCPEEKTTA
eukprot:TRINITY_DN2703_c0_g2_i1.p1 TRINITY_DN2703_c0_g2~~TRINITY_DN2703_c0_g2_i1.p1  ORF type:complete len:417 (+),score=33.94 TRINITY_DN2703_c0_g2_i1:137-1252(+)